MKKYMMPDGTYKTEDELRYERYANPINNTVKVGNKIYGGFDKEVNKKNPIKSKSTSLSDDTIEE